MGFSTRVVLLSSRYYTEFQRNVNETQFKGQKIFIVKITKYCVNISIVILLSNSYLIQAKLLMFFKKN